jgi:hypothetical protein
VYEIIAAEYIELDWIMVTYRDHDGAEITRYFESLEAIENEFSEDDALDVEHILWAIA